MESIALVAQLCQMGFQVGQGVLNTAYAFDIRSQRSYVQLAEGQAFVDPSPGLLGGDSLVEDIRW